MATDRDGFARLVEAVGGREEVAAIELNVSCPNVKSGLIVGEQPAETLALCEHLRPLTPKPLIVKLTPNTADPAAVAAAAEEGGADAVSLINTLKASALDPATMRPWLGAGSGGLSGPAVRAVALDQVRRVAAAVSIPVIGMGGIESGADALAFLAAGAAAIAVGTASFRDPRRPRESAPSSPPSSKSAGSPTLPRAQLDVDLNLRSKRISPKKAGFPLVPRCRAGLYSPPPMAPASVDTTSAAVPERSRRAADAGPQAGERNPLRARPAEARPEGRQGEDRAAPARPARLRALREGLRHDPRGPQVRPREGEQDPHPVPDLALEDDRRPLRPPARRAGPVYLPPPVRLRGIPAAGSPATRHTAFAASESGRAEGIRDHRARPGSARGP